MIEELFTLEEAADLLQVHVKTLRRHIESGKLSAFKRSQRDAIAGGQALKNRQMVTEKLGIVGITEMPTLPRIGPDGHSSWQRAFKFATMAKTANKGRE